MRRRGIDIWRRLILLGVSSAVMSLAAPAIAQPSRQALDPEYENVYAAPRPDQPGQGINEGGIHLDLAVSYLTDYVYRGVDQGEWIASQEDPQDPDEPGPDFDPEAGHEDGANIQVDGQLKWDLGKAPHPFAGVFVNTSDADPESSFQEIRPFVGLELNLRPILLAAGHTSYIHPDRDQLNTTEVWGRVEIDDSYFHTSDRPLLSPYVFGAYDYDLYDGAYLEAGLEHDIIMDDWGIVLTLQASIAWVESHPLFEVEGENVDTGLQHYQFGLVGSYELNSLLRIPQRYGTFTLRGEIYYTDGLLNDLRADTQVWGGGGLGLSY